MNENYNKNTDQRLIVDHLAEDEKALEILFSRYLKPIYDFVYRFVNNNHDVEDLVQEIFLKIWQNLKKFNQTKSFKTWLFAIVRNSTINFLNKKRLVEIQSANINLASNR